jgi:aspartate ammonia-lyase
LVKLACAKANHSLGLLDDFKIGAIELAVKKILDGQHHDHFIVDMIQGGAGTSTNMNANEVIANIGLELLGHSKGEYKSMSST